MPRQRSRPPLSPILATESATVRLFFILSVLLCSVKKAGLKTETWLLFCLRLRSRSPHNAKHSTSIIFALMSWDRHNWGERERAPSCGLNGRAVVHDIYMIVLICLTSGTRYCACAALRANVAGRIGNWVSPAESAFSACIGSTAVRDRHLVVRMRGRSTPTFT